MNIAPEIVVVGSASVDLTLNVAHLPQPGETILTDLRGASRGPGGKGANQAAAAARLGATTALLGCVGNDADADLVIASLASAGVDLVGLSRDNGATGMAVVLLDAEAENSIVVAPGANAHLSVKHLRPHASLLSQAAVVLMSMEVPMAALEYAASASQNLVVLNPAPFTTVSSGLSERVDVIVPNRGELAALLSLPVATTLTDVFEQAIAAPYNRVVVTLGAEGAVVVEFGHVELVPAPAVHAVDTVGAGDTFCAALAVGLSRKLSLVDAARKAVAAAAVAVTFPGAQSPLPPFDQV